MKHFLQSNKNKDHAQYTQLVIHEWIKIRRSKIMKLFESVWPTNVPEVIPIIPTVDVVAFPQMIIPLLIVDAKIIAGIQKAVESGNKLVIIVACKNNSGNSETTSISPQDLYSVGTIANIIRIINLQNGHAKILIQGLARAQIQDVVMDAILMGRPVHFEVSKNEKDHDPNVIQEKIAFIKKLIEELIDNDYFTHDFITLISKITSPEKIADYILSHLTLGISESQRLLEAKSYVGFFDIAIEFILKTAELSKLTQKVKSKARESINTAQKEFYVREQIKALKEELGDEQNEVDNYYTLLEKLEGTLSPDAYKEIARCISRLDTMSLESAEASVLKNYLDCVFDLPWEKETQDNMDIINAKKILDEEHYGLKSAKERILDFLSVKSFSKKNFNTIICFYGPPGTGKTSLAYSIAHALNKKCFRVSVGGMRDEAEIRGHRKTYVGAMPGRFIKGFKQVQSKNPLIIIDEIDKIGTDFKGDPASALLEVLDYQQNNAFYDYYLGIPFDLSNALFIATANKIDTIPHALRDRMELIEIPAYSLEEKYDIAKRFIIPKAIASVNLDQHNFIINDDVISEIIEKYTYEAGVRELDRVIRKLCSRAIRYFLENNVIKPVTKETLEEYLGTPKYLKNNNKWRSNIGISNGLCWTPYGGEILHLESVLMSGTGKLILTGQLGDVMKESATIALHYLKAHAEEFGIKFSMFNEYDVHIHVPSGAVSKDGPSAGMALFVSLFSCFTKKPVKQDIAMTGEIDLQGNVLPVGGIKEKVLAAQRNGVTTVLIPEANRSDVIDIGELSSTITVIYINTIQEGLQRTIVELQENVKEESNLIVDNEAILEEVHEEQFAV